MYPVPRNRGGFDIDGVDCAGIRPQTMIISLPHFVLLRIMHREVSYSNLCSKYSDILNTYGKEEMNAPGVAPLSQTGV